MNINAKFTQKSNRICILFVYQHGKIHKANRTKDIRKQQQSKKGYL